MARLHFAGEVRDCSILNGKLCVAYSKNELPKVQKMFDKYSYKKAVITVMTQDDLMQLEKMEQGYAALLEENATLAKQVAQQQDALKQAALLIEQQKKPEDKPWQGSDTPLLTGNEETQQKA